MNEVLYEIIDRQGTFNCDISNAFGTSVPGDAQAPLDATASAGVVMTKLVSRIYVRDWHPKG